jgi:hypothetical protein
MNDINIGDKFMFYDTEYTVHEILSEGDRPIVLRDCYGNKMHSNVNTIRDLLGK